MAKQKENEFGEGKLKEENDGAKKDGKDDEKAEPPGPPPIGLIQLVRLFSL